MKIHSEFLALLFFGSSLSTGYAATTSWLGNGNPALWGDALNWSAGVPSATSVANLIYPAGDATDITITSNAEAQGLIFGNNLTYPAMPYTIGATKITLGDAGITNLWGAEMTYEAATTMAASSTFTAGAGLIINQTLTMGLNTLRVASGGNTLKISGPTTLSIASASSFGKFAGTGAMQLNGALRFNFTSATGPGTWDIIEQTPTGTITSVSITGSYSGGLTNSGGVWTGTYGGLNWVYQSTTGVLTAVPEPSTWSLFALGACGVVTIRRRVKA